jgi:hypothetical protein
MVELVVSLLKGRVYLLLLDIASIGCLGSGTYSLCQ